MYNIHYQQRLLPLPTDELFLLGRGKMCAIQLDDPSASRVHCRLLYKNGKVLLTDAGSRWGTFVNGQRVEEAELNVGDTITVGETELTLSVTSNPQETTISPRNRRQRPDEIAAAPSSSQRPVAAAVVGNLPQRGITPKSHEAETTPFVPSRFLGKPFLRYQVDKLLANTRSGMLFHAQDRGLDRQVALKVFRPEYFKDEMEERRFLRAVQTMIDVRHPHLVRLFDAGEHAGLCYTVSELIAGRSTAALIDSIGIAGMLDWKTVVQIGIDICEACIEIHERGIVHRNILPQHILVRDADKQALLAEVTLAKAWDRSQLEQITLGGDVVGEMRWQSPEQLGSGEPVDHRSDLFQLGLTLYSLLTGKHPFEHQSPLRTADNILNGTPPPPQKYHLAIPDLVSDAVLRSLSTSPTHRFPDALSFRNALRDTLRYR